MNGDTEDFTLEEPTDIEADEQFLQEVYAKKSFIRDELRIVLIGKTGSGKSATGNMLTGKNTFVSKLSGSSITEICQDVMFERFGRHIQIVDTPGLFDTRADNKLIGKEIKKCVLMTSPGIHALVLVTKVGRFTEEEKKTVEYFKKVFGQGLGKYLMIVFTGKDDLDADDTTIQNFVRSAPKPLQELVTESNSRYMAVNNRASKEEKEAQAKQMIDNIESMVKDNGGKCYTTSMFRKAEAIIKKREEEEMRRLEEEKRAEREAIANAIKEKYDVVMQEQEHQMKDLQTDLQQIQAKSKEEQFKHQQAVEGLKSQLDRAEDERKQIEIDRQHWEEERRKEMEKKEEERNQAMLMMMEKMEEERKRREVEMDKKMKAAEEERQRREAEMRRREEEREKREDERRKQMQQLEENRQKELQKMREEQRRQEEDFRRRMEEESRRNARQRSSGGGEWEHVTIGNPEGTRHLNEAFLQDLYSGQSFVKDETRIVLIGKTGSGKSATGNNLAGRKAFESRFSASSITRQCRQEMVRRFDRHIQIVDTPGLFDTGMSIEDTSKEIMKCVAMTAPGIHAIVLVTRLNRFTEEEQKTVEHFVRVFGKDVLQYLVILFTGKDELDSHGMTIENYVQTSPGPLQKLVSACGGRYYVVNNLAPAEEKEKWASYFIQEVDRLVQRNGGRCYTTEMYRQAEIMMKKREEELKRKIEEEKRAERELIEQSIKGKYDEVAREHEQHMHQLQSELKSVAEKGDEDQKKYQDAVDQMHQKLQAAEEEKNNIEKDRQKWEEERRKEMEKHEKDRNEAMLKMMDKLEEDRRRREEEMDARMESIEADRREREAEVRKLEEEREKRQREYEEKMLEMEKQKQKDLEDMREEMEEEKRRRQREMEELARQAAREEAQGEKGGFFNFIGRGLKTIASVFFPSVSRVAAITDQVFDDKKWKH